VTIPCGSHSGYNAHLRRGEQPCEHCKEGHRDYQRDLDRRHAGEEPVRSRRDDLMRKLAAVNAMYASIGAVTPYSLETAALLDDKNLELAVVAAARRLMYVQRVLDEAW
jgi:hypothetical protein